MTWIILWRCYGCLLVFEEGGCGRASPSFHPNPYMGVSAGRRAMYTRRLSGGKNVTPYFLPRVKLK